MTKYGTRGFSLIEALVVIAIIGILTAIGLAVFSDARENTLQTKAEAELHELRNAIYTLGYHTGKMPGGCPLGELANKETPLTPNRAGLAVEPIIYKSGRCEWTAEDIENWSGPYIQSAIDPWGKSYILDPDYYSYRKCDDIPEEPPIQVIASWGPDGDWYTCDDVYMEIE